MRRLLIVMGIVILLAALIVRFGSGMVAEKAISHYLDAKEIPYTRLDVGHASLRSAYLREATLGEGDALQLSGVAANYAYADEKLTLTSLDAARVKATIHTHEGQWDVGGLEALLNFPAMGAQAKTKALRLVLDAPVNVTLQGTRMALRIDNGTVELSQSGTTLRVKKLKLVITPHASEAETYDWSVESPDAQLSAGDDTLSEPLRISLSGTASQTQIEGQGTLSDAGKMLPIIVRLKHNVKTGTTRLQWMSNSWNMSENDKGFAVFSPVLATLPPLNAKLRMEGEATLKKGKKPNLSHRFVVEEAELQPLLKLVFNDDIAFTGKVAGTIPLKWNGEKSPQIVKAELKNTESGTLIYDPLTGASAALQGEKQASILLEALRKFNYSSLDVTANSDAAGALVATFRIIGANPELYGGKTVDFTLTVNGNLLSIIESQSRVKDAINTSKE